MGAVAVRHDPASAALVRRMITQELRALALSTDTIDDVVLVASELVGNAVVHTDHLERDLDIGWSFDGDHVRVWVADTSPHVPEQRSPDASATSGRGLAIVAAVSADWGVEPLPDGKRVWASVRATRG